MIVVSLSIAVWVFALIAGAIFLISQAIDNQYTVAGGLLITAIAAIIAPLAVLLVTGLGFFLSIPFLWVLNDEFVTAVLKALTS